MRGRKKGDKGPIASLWSTEFLFCYLSEKIATFVKFTCCCPIIFFSFYRHHQKSAVVWMISVSLTSFPPPRILTPIGKEDLTNYYNWLEQTNKKVLHTEKGMLEFLLGTFPSWCWSHFECSFPWKEIKVISCTDTHLWKRQVIKTMLQTMPVVSKLSVSTCPHTRAQEIQNTHLIQDSSSSISRKNWCKRWDSFSFARRAAAMLLILWKRPLMVSRLSFTWEVSKALLVIRLSAWLFRSFRRSWKRGWKTVWIAWTSFLCLLCQHKNHNLAAVQSHRFY